MFHKVEQSYDFRKRLTQIHREGLRVESARVYKDERFEVSENTRIVLPSDPSAVILRAAKDLQEYLSVSMGIDVQLERSVNLGPPGNPGGSNGSEPERQNCIILTTRTHQPVDLLNGNCPRGYRIDCSTCNAVITGYDDEGVLQGVFYLEECMSMFRSPFLESGTTSRAPLFSPRMVHSGYGQQQYPDAYLGVIAHAGFDSILVTVKDVDITHAGPLDFNDICQRAAQWGLSVYAYSHLGSSIHPSDPGAEEYYDQTYGSIFKACPAFKGIVLVGETLDSFPSKDERTTGRPLFAPNPDGFQDSKPAPGWWPCRDYPELVGIIKASVQKFRPDADIVFWTYNWGYAPEKERIELIDSLPTDISLLATFEMSEKVQRGGMEEFCTDYTLMCEGPGSYFLSEAKAAARRGIRLYSMTNTAGLTWDIGVIPYEPVPGQWMKRYKGILEARERYGLCGLMENHDYGFYPSFIADLAKAAFTKGAPGMEESLRMIAAREFGTAGAEAALEALASYNEGIANYVCTDADQYGPFRIGPTYPLVLFRKVTVPTSPDALAGFGQAAYMPDMPWLVAAQPFPIRLKAHVRLLESMEASFAKGADILEKSLPFLADDSFAHDNAVSLMNLGRYIACCTRTTIHVKLWWLQKTRLMAAETQEEYAAAIKALQEIAADEIANTEAAIPLVRADSRLGWVTYYEYIGDEAHLRWKIRQVRGVMEDELPIFLNKRGNCYPYTFLI
ncbi:hypothetical protein [Paenibacillus eucommiae]|uniref:Uncharacterized protein n=1 Tax=Paenibacillus eucommiae TaxID=1355755 RepID=A0ABS4IU11_9BACL|nr:hypothetical protein [Paenibacillus eucommiae]MBP1991072.1 hypothetical protein [Paenibacillus eucommiae]